MLAGALGAAVKSFRLLLPKESDWRHGVGTPEKTPYYDNATLYWQKKQGDWSVPAKQLEQDI